MVRESLFKDIRATTLDGIRGVEALIQRRIRTRESSNFPNNVSWKDDDSLKVVVSSIKTNAEVISGSSTKLALLIKTNPTDDALMSLLAEMNMQLQAILGQY